MALGTRDDPISVWLRRANTTEELARLRDPSTSYMSPPSPKFVGAGFACRDCDWYRHHQTPLEFPSGQVVKIASELTNDLVKGIGYCMNPNIRARVQFQGCCNRYTFEGISTFQKT